MRILKNILGKIWLVWAGLAFVLFFLVTYPLLLIFLSTPKMYPLAHFMRRCWGVFTSLFALWLPIITKDENIPTKRRIVYCSNHMSHLDILTAGTYLPGFNFFVGKISLSRIPLFGIWFKTLDVPVERAKARESYKAFVAAANQFDKGIDLIIFGEGGIPNSAPVLAKLKDGPFRIAIEKDALIVPVTIADNYKRFDINNWWVTPGKMRMHIHKAIDTRGLQIQDIDSLKDKVFITIQSQLIKMGVPQS